MHQVDTCITPEATTGQTKLAALDKLGFGRMFGVSKRTVDTWLAAGCPHLKLSERAVRLPLPEAADWVRSRFMTQRRAAPSPKAPTNGHAPVAAS